ncbi:hypothetical protein O181_087545 [Austropuccinia psidii MF-1]|uniref:Uncharacterized protein n=1 Tax=Austropuccinia psidii MF-1 TaxID=1389203 RepID=A0A9Q3IPU8_9BASI|nr:hypothetical protein [Austropuccinia psidii MF-1]
MKKFHKDMERAAKRHGMKTKSIPFLPETTTGDETIEKIHRTKKTLPSPTPKAFAISTPGKFPRAKRFEKRVHIKTQTQKNEIVTITTRNIVKIKAKDYNLNFDGYDVEDFITRAKRIA